MSAKNALLAFSFVYAAWIWVAAKSPWRFSNVHLAAALFASVCLFGVGLLAVNLLIAVMARTIWPLGVFALCALSPWLLPTITPEELYLAQHRTEYEKLVQLVRLKQLKHADYCQVDYYVPPVGLEELNLTSCIFVPSEPEIGMLLQPRVRGRFLLYTETGRPEIVCTSSAAVVEKKLDDHWYICVISAWAWP